MVTEVNITVNIDTIIKITEQTIKNITIAYNKIIRNKKITYVINNKNKWTIIIKCK